MTENNKYSTRGGFGLSTLLFLIFLVLKLTNYITWSWLWITSPLWIPWAIVLGVFIILFPISQFIKYHAKKDKTKFRNR